VKTENEKGVGINYFLSCEGGVRRSPLVLRPQIGLMIDEHKALVEEQLARKTWLGASLSDTCGTRALAVGNRMVQNETVV
jgi:hypothetical protein